MAQTLRWINFLGWAIAAVHLHSNTLKNKNKTNAHDVMNNKFESENKTLNTR